MIPEVYRRFRSRTALVTGAGQGIGEAIVRQLVAEGAFVYAMDINPGPLGMVCCDLNKGGPVVEAVVADVSNAPEVEEVVQKIEGKSYIDHLVIGAGVLNPMPFEDVLPERWAESFDVNLHGAYFVSRSVAKRMVSRHRGSIVMLASNAGSTPRMNMMSYCSSKAAVLMLSKCMGLELARHGVRCNSVSPGSTATPMLSSLIGVSDQARQRLILGDLDAFKPGIPLGKIATVEDIAKSVAFLLSDDAGHITMQDVVIDGGATL